MPPDDVIVPPYVQIPQTCNVMLPAPQQGFPMPISEWSYLRDKVAAIQVPSSVFQIIGSAALGVAGSALVALLTTPFDKDGSTRDTHPLLIGTLVLFAAIGGLSLLFGHMQKKTLKCTKDDVLLEMQRIQARLHSDASDDTT